jgi:hypothetical protein
LSVTANWQESDQLNLPLESTSEANEGSHDPLKKVVLARQLIARESHDNCRHHIIIIISLLIHDAHYYGYIAYEINFWGAKRP